MAAWRSCASGVKALYPSCVRCHTQGSGEDTSSVPAALGLPDEDGVYCRRTVYGALYFRPAAGGRSLTGVQPAQSAFGPLPAGQGSFGSVASGGQWEWSVDRETWFTTLAAGAMWYNENTPPTHADKVRYIIVLLLALVSYWLS